MPDRAVVASPDPERCNIVKALVALKSGNQETPEPAKEKQDTLEQTIAVTEDGFAGVLDVDFPILQDVRLCNDGRTERLFNADPAA